MSASDLNFGEMYEFVKGDRFSPTKETEIKAVLNTVYGTGWNSNQWDFRYNDVNVSVEAGNRVLQDTPDDLGPINVLVNESGWRVNYEPPRAFFQYAQGITDLSAPTIYTRTTDEVLLAPTPETSSTQWRVAYEKRMQFMVDDDDTPNWPAEHRYNYLVQAARAQMLASENDPTFDVPQGYSEQALEAVKRDYISDRRYSLLQYGRDALAGAEYEGSV